MSIQRAGAVGRRMHRREDRRLLTGRGRFTGDIEPAGALHAVFVRSSFAHARIRAIDARAAMAVPGVHRVFTGADLAELGVGELPVTWIHPGQHGTSNPLLANDKVFYSGQAVAVVIAEDPYLAEDAAELVNITYEQLPVLVDADAALEPGATVLHEDWGTNVLVEVVVEGGDVDAAFESADLTISGRFAIQRLCAAPIENRAAVAAQDPSSDQLVLWSSTQVPHYGRTVICRVCGWPEQRLRVIAPDVGGGFGVKDHPYAEEVLICALAARLRTPVKWVEDPQENFLSAVHARQQIWTVELAATRAGRVIAVRGRVLYDIGGHSSNHGIGPARVSADMLLGPYDVQSYQMQVMASSPTRCRSAPTGDSAHRRRPT